MAEETKKPVRRFKAGNVEVAVWENEHGGRKFHSFKISRFYKKEKSEKWENSDYITSGDLADAALLLQRAFQEYGIKSAEDVK